jgi:hypothetical protein
VLIHSCMISRINFWNVISTIHACSQKFVAWSFGYCFRISCMSSSINFLQQSQENVLCSFSCFHWCVLNSSVFYLIGQNVSLYSSINLTVWTHSLSYLYVPWCTGSLISCCARRLLCQINTFYNLTNRWRLNLTKRRFNTITI